MLVFPLVKTVRRDETDESGRSTSVTEFQPSRWNLSDVSRLLETAQRLGALLHDIGKIAIPDAILRKPGPLTDEEWVIMRMHPVYGNELLSPIANLRPAMDIPHYHPEKCDGTGYPHGLKGEQIPLAAWIFAVVGVWDAPRSDRPYRKGWSGERVLDYLRTQRATHFEPELGERFLRLLVIETDSSMTEPRSHELQPVGHESIYLAQ